MEIFVEVLDVCQNHLYPQIMNWFGKWVDILMTPLGKIIDDYVTPWWQEIFQWWNPLNMVDDWFKLFLPQSIQDMSLISVIGGSAFIIFIAVTVVKWIIGIVM